MSNRIAIEIKDLTLSYKLYPNPLLMALDLFNLKYLFPWKKFNFPKKHAINNLNLTIQRGDRIGIIGRNGAGKTSLLKIITGILTPTTGTVAVSGNIQSLLTSGLGFEPELSGMENIKSSLIYNGLYGNELKEAISDIIDFCELGDYIHQPLKTYSLGMQSRLAFAASTAIKPDILIIDEVLGAGDAYFINKCAARIKKLTQSKNTTLLLVSHSTSQVLKFCDKCIWIEDGNIVESGDPMSTVKKYDKFINDLQSKKILETNISKSLELVSRWESKERDVYISDVKILDKTMQPTASFETGASATFEVSFKKMNPIEDVYPVLMAYNESGVTTFFCYEKMKLDTSKQEHTIQAHVGELNIGPGNYYLSVAIYKQLDLNDLNNSIYCDLIDRSFQFQVIDPIVKNNPAVAKINYEWKVL